MKSPLNGADPHEHEIAAIECTIKVVRCLAVGLVSARTDHRTGGRDPLRHGA